MVCSKLAELGNHHHTHSVLDHFLLPRKTPGSSPKPQVGGGVLGAGSPEEALTAPCPLQAPSFSAAEGASATHPPSLLPARCWGLRVGSGRG